uniref:histidine kinase n=1 Tax=Gracilinema caldarium TaxID=215591 RepID=A0A7C3IFW7_9SPIR
MEKKEVHILLVEDELISALLTKKQLEDYGYKVHHVQTGEDAVSIVTEKLLPVDVLLIDIDLGSDMYGTEAAERILAHEDIPVIFYSSHAERDVVEKTEGITSYGYVLKNAGIVVLDASIKMAIKLFTAKVEQKRTEEKLRESEALFRAVFEQHTAVKLLVDPADGKILDANFAAEQFYGWTREQLKTMYIHDINTLFREEVAKEMQKAVEKKRNYFQFKHRRADGSIRDVEVYSSTLEVKGKPILHSIIHDDTERIWAERELQKQLKEKEILLREVHHRVKNNIATLIALLRFQADTAKDSQVRNGLLEAIARAESMQELYEKLLISGNYQEVSMKAYFEDLINAIVALFLNNLNITIQTSIADFHLDTKRATTLGIITNELLTNVLKYAFVGRKTGTILIQIKKEGPQVSLLIEDDGVGIDEQKLQAKTTGFGLTLIKMLAEELGGTFTLQNNHGTKSMVQFEL